MIFDRFNLMISSEIYPKSTFFDRGNPQQFERNFTSNQIFRWISNATNGSLKPSNEKINFMTIYVSVCYLKAKIYFSLLKTKHETLKNRKTVCVFLL